MHGLNAEILIQNVPCKAGEVSAQPHSMVDFFFPYFSDLKWDTSAYLFIF